MTYILLKITYLNIHSNLPGANELKMEALIQINEMQHLNHNQLTH